MGNTCTPALIKESKIFNGTIEIDVALSDKIISPYDVLFIYKINLTLKKMNYRHAKNK